MTRADTQYSAFALAHIAPHIPQMQEESTPEVSPRYTGLNEAELERLSS